MKFYVYEHWRPDRQVCFYVGKGHGDRAHYFSYRRNDYHRNTVSKLVRLGLAVEVRIIAEGLTEIEAFTLEVQRIAHWRAEGVRLTNLTNGGEGAAGFTLTEKQRADLRARMKRLWLQPEMRDRWTAAAKEANNRPEVKTRMSIALREASARPETRSRRRASAARPETKLRMSIAAKEVMSRLEVKEKIRSAVLARGIAKWKSNPFIQYAEWVNHNFPIKSIRMRPVVVEKLYRQGLTMGQIAMHLGVSSATVYHDLKECGVSIISAWTRPGTRERHSAAMKKSHARPEIRICISSATKEAMVSEEVRSRIRTMTKQAMARPEVQRRHRSAMAQMQIKSHADTRTFA